MTFGEKLYNVVTAEIGSLFTDGGIYTHNLPLNFSYKSPVCVIQYRLSERVECLDGFTGQEDYECQIVIISKSTHLNAQKADSIITTFEDYEDDQIADMQFLDDINEVDFDLGYYIKSLNYKIVFNNN